MMFNLYHLIKNKIRSATSIQNSEFFGFVHAELLSRLLQIDKTYTQGILVGFDLNSLVLKTLQTELSTKLSGKPNIKIISPDQLDLIEKKWADFICFPFGLHWIANVQKFLLQVNLTLKDNGIFISNFAGSGSLNNLRKTLFSAEEAATKEGTLPTHFAHISPFIRFEDVSLLLAGAGFTENIIDFESIVLEYDSVIGLMKALKNVGESNVLQNRNYYSINKQVYKILKEKQSFEDQVILITSLSSPKKNTIKFVHML